MHDDSWLSDYFALHLPNQRAQLQHQAAWKSSSAGNCSRRQATGYDRVTLLADKRCSSVKGESSPVRRRHERDAEEGWRDCTRWAGTRKRSCFRHRYRNKVTRLLMELEKCLGRLTPSHTSLASLFP